MTNEQNKEFTKRVRDNVMRLMAKGVDFTEAQKRVFDALNNEFPTALAAWIAANKQEAA